MLDIAARVKINISLGTRCSQNLIQPEKIYYEAETKVEVDNIDGETFIHKEIDKDNGLYQFCDRSRNIYNGTYGEGLVEKVAEPQKSLLSKP